jgi:hypothetical protein
MGSGAECLACQTLDWIMQEICGQAPLLDHHQHEQHRVANSGLNFLRDVANAVERTGRLTQAGQRPSDLVELCDEEGISIPGCGDNAPDNMRAMKVERVFTRLFKRAVEIEISGFKIREETADEYDPGSRKTRPVTRYCFEKINDVPF